MSLSLKTTCYFTVIFIILVWNGCKTNQKATGSSKNESLPSKSGQVIQTAHYYDGAPYKIGGESKSGIDCSGLVMVSYKKAGIALPRTSMEQSKVGKEIKLTEAKAGDLVFFRFRKVNKNPVNHVGIISKKEPSGIIYFIHASNSLGVTESSLSESYYHESFVKVMRVLE